MTRDESQFEEYIVGNGPVDPSLDRSVQARIAEHRAIRHRLKIAMGSIAAPAGLTERISARLDAEGDATPARDGRAQPRILRLPARLGAAAAIAAGIVLAVGILWQLGAPAVANAQPDLFRIHQANLTEANGQFTPVSDPGHATSQIRTVMGIEPLLPADGAEATVDGCATGQVFDEKVATYRVKLNQGHASVILLRRDVSDLGFQHPFRRAGRDFAWCRHQGCRMVAARIGELTYVAVSDAVDQGQLTDLLEGIAARRSPR